MTETYETILQRMKNNFLKQAGYNADDASDIGIRLKVLAGEVFSLRTALDWLECQTFAQTAQGKGLDLRARERGLTRKEAKKAKGTLEFIRTEPLWYNAHIEKGTVCATSGVDGVRFVTTEDATLPMRELKVKVPAVAELGGGAGNAATGAVTVMVTPPGSIQSVKNSTAFTGGEDRESDEQLRARLMKSYTNLSNGTNAAFYKECAVRHSGVYSAGVIPRENGAGTVTLYLGGRGEVPSAEVIQSVKEKINSLRELNVTVKVLAAEKIPLDFSILLTPLGGTFLEAEAAVRETVKEYFNGLSVGDSFVTAALGNKIFSTGLLKNYTILNKQDVWASAKQLIVPKTIKIEKSGVA